MRVVRRPQTASDPAEGARPIGRRRTALVVSVVVHLVMAAMLVGMREQTTSPPTPRWRSVALVAMAAPKRAPGDGGGGGGGQRPAAAAVAASPRAQPAQRTTRPARPAATPGPGAAMPSSEPTPTAADPARASDRSPAQTDQPATDGEPSAGDADGSEGGGGDDHGDGDGGGEGGGRGAGAGAGRGTGQGYLAAASTPPALVRPTGYSKARPARLIWPVRRGEEREGTLFVARVRVDRDGLVVGAKLVSASPNHRESEAVSAVWRFRYEPALDDDGVPIASWVEQSFIVRR